MGQHERAECACEQHAALHPKAPVYGALTAMASITSATQRTRFWKIFPSSGRTGLHCIALHANAKACHTEAEEARPCPTITAPRRSCASNTNTNTFHAAAMRRCYALEPAQHAQRRVMPRAQPASKDVP
jgi:hypothetical protein